MNRCLPAPNRHLYARHFLRATMTLLIGASSLILQSATAQEQVRQFPASARRGMLEVTLPPAILINGRADSLSPGARIRGVNNLLVQSASLVGQRVLVNYVREPNGQVHEVWILNDAEAREQRSGMAPITNFVFGADADKPKTDDGKTPFDQLPKFPAQ